MPAANLTSNSKEWYTPTWLIDAAKTVLGSIDLDPASCEVANSTVGAKKFYSTDGFLQPWEGNVFCNPPGDKSGKSVRAFWDHAILERARTNCKVFWIGFNLNQLAILQPSPVEFRTCILRKRVAYLSPNTMQPQKSPAHHTYVTLLCGADFARESRFREIFSKLGAML